MEERRRRSRREKRNREGCTWDERGDCDVNTFVDELGGRREK